MKKNKNLNYDFNDQVEPLRRMGEGKHSNMPSDPIFGSFGKPTYRAGNINSFTSSISDLSGISENGSLNGYDKKKR